LKESFTALAQNEDWLANNFDKIIHSQDVPPQDDDAGTTAARVTVAETEERILRCLGAAVKALVGAEAGIKIIAAVHSQCPLRVISRHVQRISSSPLHPQKQTCAVH
jgi:hypothetical protein